MTPASRRRVVKAIQNDAGTIAGFLMLSVLGWKFVEVISTW